MRRAVRFACPLFVAAAFSAGALPTSAQTIHAQFPAGLEPAAVAVNPVTNKIYIANYASNDVTVVDGATHAATAIPVGAGPQHIAVNAATNKIYVSNVRASTVSVIDGSTHAVTTVFTGGSGPIAINPATDRTYVIRQGLGDEINVIYGPSHHTYAMATYSYQPVAIAVNPRTNTLYVAHYTTGDVKAIDLSVDAEHPVTRSVGVWSKPMALAVNPATNKIYVISDDTRGPIGIIDGATHTATFLNPAGHARGPRAIAVNTATNKVYAAFSGEVIVIDGATQAMAFVPSGSAGMPGPVAVAINEYTNKVYVPNAQGFVTVIDGATNTAVHVDVPRHATSVAVNPNTNRVYVAGPGVTVINGATASTLPPPVPAVNVQGLWWRSPGGSESGWGINLVHQADTVLATWFTYDANGDGMWLIMSNAARIGPNAYSGKLYRTTGPPFSSPSFDPSRIVYDEVGSATLSFSDASNGTLTAIVSGVNVSKPITRMVFASPVPTCTTGGSAGAIVNYQDLWWRSPAASESGWGINLTHQGDILFATWYTYGADGRALWLSATLAKTGNTAYSGTLYRSWGQPFSMEPWNPARVTRMPVGNITFTFSDAHNGVMAYTVEGISQSKTVTRMVYASPPSVCR